MTEKKIIHESESIARDKDIEGKVGNFLKENQGSAFTIKALNNKLEQIINDNDVLEYTRENLQEILNNLRNNKTIDTAEHNGEIHYLFKKSDKKVQEEQKVKLEPIKR